MITVPNTDNPTASAVTHTGAKVVLADTTGDTFTMDPEKLEAKITPRTKVILPVHLFGHPADMDPICEVADNHGIAVLEDSALAVGGEYKGRRTGTFGPLGCFSVAPGKILGGYGDGGMVVTNDPDQAHRIRVLRNYGHAPGLRLSGKDLTGGTGWRVLEEGYNQRLDTLQAAILSVKLLTLEERIAGRRRAADLYRRIFSGTQVTPVHEAPWARHVYFAYNAMVPVERRDDAREYLASRGIATRLYYNPPLHLHPAFRWMGLEPGSLPVAGGNRGAHDRAAMFPPDHRFTGGRGRLGAAGVHRVELTRPSQETFSSLVASPYAKRGWPGTSTSITEMCHPPRLAR